MVFFAMISSLPREAESAGKISIHWADWSGFGVSQDGTYFFRVHEYCRNELPAASLLNCVFVALDWGDIQSFTAEGLLVPPAPPRAKFSNGDNENALGQRSCFRMKRMIFGFDAAL